MAQPAETTTTTTTRIATDHEAVSFVAHHPAFNKLLGPKPSARLLLESPDKKTPLYHEACVYHHATRSVFVTSNQIPSDQESPHTSSKQVKLVRVYDNETASTSSAPARAEFVHFQGIEGALLNGGVNFGPDSLLLCAQGSQRDDDLQGLVVLEIPASTDTSTSSSTSTSTSTAKAPQTLVSSFYGVPFNSVNDVIVHPRDQSVWFTDPAYGYHQGVRRAPQLPNQVYRFDPATKAVRAIADGFTRPNGLCFSPDLNTLYVTDTGAIHGSSAIPFDPTGPSHIYAFDVVHASDGQGPFLANKRLFAFAAGRCPDGIKTDTRGNVYSGCGDGIEVWDSAGVLLGLVAIAGGVANFCFGDRGTVYACNETRLWKITLDQDGVRGALLGI